MRTKGHRVPIRTCVGCRARDEQSALVRAVATSGRVRVDCRRRLPGRGAWVHPRSECVARAARGGLARSLRVQLAASDREDLIRIARDCQVKGQ